MYNFFNLFSDAEANPHNRTSMIAGKSLDPRQAEDGLNPSLGPGVLDPDGLTACPVWMMILASKGVNNY